eukprot:Plantae.Rhodophyta-Hildenbrandia_rubra.ctg12150.p1 GENE.Plantae.Rhodophyta-Hildenbrandia_rubra.ctg12150~~Plantae.Rhodophyta-Hildenbrandia_rubra.ctg12150.p1  ORF type:complete len:425 (+),score=57.38 Plantae.Rhodophyta-Hildenbrandia_rubra.ctg12150:266-1540(+)
MASESNGARPVKAVILVGGGSKGTRFRPLSLDLPKPLFPIAGSPMIKHHIEALSKVPGLIEVILMGFYDESPFRAFIDDCSETYGVSMRYLREAAELGTSGGLNRYRDVIIAGDPAAVLILHCDVGCAFPLQEMLDFHFSKGTWGTILGKELSEEEAHKYGAMVIDPETKELMHYAEKPTTNISSLINCGVYVFSPALFEYIASVNDEMHRGKMYVPYFETEAVKIRLEQDVLMPLTGKGKLHVLETKDFWVQMKDPKAALTGNSLYLEHYKKTKPHILAHKNTGKRETRPSSTANKANGRVGHETNKLQIVGNVFIHPTAKISPSARIGPDVAIGPGVDVRPGARLRDCVILDDVKVKDHAVVRDSILGWGSSVGYWARVQGSELRPTIFGSEVTTDPEVIISGCIVLPNKGLSRSCYDEIIL